MTPTTVHMLWIYGELPWLPRLSLASHLYYGSAPVLWTYERGLDAPKGVEVRDARGMLPESEVERYRFKTGQVSLFGDRFCWEVLLREGGWWSHTDLTLRGTLDRIEEPYVFGPHHRYVAGMPLWKMPAGHPALMWMIEEAGRSVRTPMIDWHALMAIADAGIKKFDLAKWVQPNLHNNDTTDQPILDMTEPGSSLPKGWDILDAIHWNGSGRVRAAEPWPASYAARLWEKFSVA